MLVTISGHSGCGKNSTADLLAKKLRAKVVDTGTIFRAMAKKHGMDVVEFGHFVESHPEIDRNLDDEMVHIAEKTPRLILLGRLTGWMTKQRGLPAVRVWLAATARTRAKRICGRECVSYRDSLRTLMRRDSDNVIRYKKVYSLDLNDLSIYDIVVPTDNRSLEQVVNILSRRIPKIWLKIRQKMTSSLPKKPRSNR